jgi:outer membrane murein-binding lipoprotein Lpp
LDQGILLAIVIPTATVLVGMLVNNRQLDSLRGELSAKIDRVDGRVDSLRNEMNARFEAQTQALLRVEQVLDARLQHIEERYR